MRSRIDKGAVAVRGARQFVEAVSLDAPFRHFPDFRVVAVRRIAPSGDLGNGKIHASRAGGWAGGVTAPRCRNHRDLPGSRRACSKAHIPQFWRAGPFEGSSISYARPDVRKRKGRNRREAAGAGC